MSWIDELKFVTPDWSVIYGMIRDLSKRIMDKGFQPDVIVGISLGGLIPARVVADLLGLDMDTVRVKFYKGVDERGVRPKIVQDLSMDISGKTVLLVDDVADSGHTLKEVKKHLHSKGVKDLHVCTLHFKPWSIVEPDIYIEKTGEWIIYPWERMETMRNILQRLGSEGFSDEEMKKKMVERGIPECFIVDEFTQV